jgi:error-prone DNA polymerase
MELDDERYPLFDTEQAVPPPINNQQSTVAQLPPMPLGQEVMTDYSTTGLSLKQHPVSLIRDQLDEMRITPTCQLADLPQERWVKCAGLVLIRQRPATASGIVFETIEDETGVANIIIRSDVYDRYRAAARHATLLQVDGYIERSGQVIHIMAKRLTDLSYLIANLEARSRDFH